MDEDGSKIKVNREGTNGANGSIDGGLLVFQEFAGTKSDIRLSDLARDVRQSLPGKVNTRRWEFWPSMSDDRLLFGRIYPNGRREIVLVDLPTRESTTLDRTRQPESFLAPGQVNGEWAVWHKCPAKDRCVVVRRNLVTGKEVVLKKPAESQYAPSVDIDGTVYYARSGRSCGNRARIIRHPLTGTKRSCGVSRAAATSAAHQSRSTTTAP